MKADRKKVKLVMERAHMTVHDVAKADIAQAVAPMLKTSGRAGGGSSQGAEPPKLPAGQVRVDTTRFAEAVARSGLTAAQLARRAGVTPETVRSITRGAEAHKAETVDKLADALGVAVCNIIKREGNP